MKKFFSLFIAALMSVSMFARTEQQDISIAASDWGWGYGSQVVNSGDMLLCALSNEWGAMATGWNPTIDISGWDKIIILVDYMSGCDGEWFKLKAYLRDYVNKDSEDGQMEGLLGLDAPDNQQNYLVIDLKQEGKNVNLTAVGVLGIQCQPNGAYFKISRVYLEREVEDAAAKYYVVGNMTNWEVNENYEMNPSLEAETEEYFYGLDLTTASQFKVVKVEGETQTWYPDGMGNNYGEHGEIERDGEYTIYFRPNGDGDEDWFYGCIFAARKLVYEDVVVGALLPENGKPENGVVLVGTFSDEPMATEVIEETGGYIAVFEADGGDTFTFVDADDEDNYLVMRNASGEWVPAVFTFEDVWEDDTWKGSPVKMIDMDLSDNSKYAWSTDIPEGLDEVQGDKAESRKVMIDGMLYIVRDGKMYNVLGTEIR